MDKPTPTTYNPKQPSKTNPHTGSKCRVRSLFQEKLGYTATTDDGLAVLRERYAKYLPVALNASVEDEPEAE